MVHQDETLQCRCLTRNQRFMILSSIDTRLSELKKAAEEKKLTVIGIEDLSRLRETIDKTSICE